MLKFLRNKVISVDRSKPGELTVHGRLDDDLYGLDMVAVFSQDLLEIKSIDGKWFRYTTPECPRALDQLQPAVGMRLAPGFRAGVAKVIGRGACRHFANLLIEMAHAAKNARLAIAWMEAKEKDPDLDLERFVAQWTPEQTVSTENEPAPAQAAAPSPTAQRAARAGQSVVLAEAPRPSGGMVLDLHMHTAPASPCSSISVEALIAEAKKIGLDGMVITDHNHIWSAEAVARLGREHDFLVLRGNEIITDQGDMLVYGFHEDIKEMIKLEDLSRRVRDAGGFIAAAHPFRGFLITGAERMGLDVEHAAARRMFEQVDAVEVLNGKVTPGENDFAAKVAKAAGLPGTGGSDAHENGTVGCYATEFTVPVKSEADLVQALRSGAFRAVRFRE